MKEKGPDHEALARYVLGLLPEEEQSRIEEEYVRDDAAFEHVLAVEDDLLHEYALGGLSERERRAVEERLLATNEGRERLERARSLLAALRTDDDRVRRPWPWWGLAAAALLAVAAGAWLLVDRPSAVREEARLAPKPSPVTASATPTAPPTSPAPARGRVVLLALASGLARGDAEARRVTLRADDAALRLTLALPSPSAAGGHRVVVASAEGREVWSGTAAAAGRGGVVAEIPAARLPEGDYEVVLTAGPDREEVASYSFGVLRE